MHFTEEESEALSRLEIAYAERQAEAVEAASKATHGPTPPANAVTTTGYHQVTLQNIKDREADLEETAQDERYVDRSMGYGFEDYLEDVEKSFATEGRRWDLGSNMESPEVKALKKIFRRVCREMREL